MSWLDKLPPPPTEFEIAQWKREDAEHEKLLEPFRKQFGRYEDWSMDDLQYLLRELKEGFKESDDFSFAGVAGIGMAQDAILRSQAELPTAILNDIWLAADVLINLHDEELDDQSTKVVEKIWDLTCNLATPENGFHKSHPFTGEVFELKPPD